MTLFVLALIPLAVALSALLTRVLISLGHRYRTFDSAGVPGQSKIRRLVPNTGGIAIFHAISLPMLVGLLWAMTQGAEGGAAARPLPAFLPDAVALHIPGLASEARTGLLLLACLLLLHLLGLVDDRRPLGPWLKLAIMAVPALATPLVLETRLFTFLDPVVGGAWLSVILTALWVLVVTNAMNFMDNMDGLSAGVASVAGTSFLAAALLNGQWFVAATLALLVGACVGFLLYNAPRPSGAKIFMGDGGSLVLGFLLAFLTVRTTYIHLAEQSADPARLFYGVFMPLVVLAVPLYDFASVVLIRLSQRRSPFVGDQQHLSHRLVKLGLSKPSAVVVIWGFAAVTGIGGIYLGRAAPEHAALIGIQTFLMLAILAVFEFAQRRDRSPPTDAAP